MRQSKHRNPRDNEMYKAFRRFVLKRDSYTCQYPNCKVRSSLEVHHIKKYANHHRLRTEVFNGVTLCKKHHCLVTGKEEQYESLFFRTVIANANQPECEKLNAPKRIHRRKKTGSKNIKRNNKREVLSPVKNTV